MTAKVSKPTMQPSARAKNMRVGPFQKLRTNILSNGYNAIKTLHLGINDLRKSHAENFGFSLLTGQLRKKAIL